jgi:hypothetical protein
MATSLKPWAELPLLGELKDVESVDTAAIWPVVSSG